MANPSVEQRTLAVPKEGGEASDYEDAAAIAAEAWPVCAAVADGATESGFAQLWARRLVRGVVQAEATTAEALRDAVPRWQAEWRGAVDERAQGRPWYVTAKAAEGAYAALLGLSLHANGRWRAVSVGDCCLFHVREEAVVRRWPFETPDAFTHRPALVASRPDRSVPSPETTTGAWRAGDRFLLASDAVAAWLMRADPVSLSALDADAFREAVETARADEVLRNDDATLLVLELATSPDANEDPAVDA